jgi:hypothetical protein
MTKARPDREGIYLLLIANITLIVLITSINLLTDFLGEMISFIIASIWNKAKLRIKIGFSILWISGAY